MVQEGLRRRLRYGVTWSVAGAVASQGSNILVGIVVANLRGRTVFGEYSMIQSTIASITMLGALGAGITVSKYVAQFRSTAPDRAGRVLGLGLIVTTVSALLAGALLAASASWLATSWLQAPQLRVPLSLAAILIPFQILSMFGIGALTGLEAYSLSSRGAMIAGASNLVFCAFGAAWLGLAGTVAGLVVGAVAQFVWLVRALQLEMRAHAIVVNLRSSWQERDVLLNFGLPAGLAGFSTLPAVWIANSILTRQPGGLPLLAIFGAAFTLKTVVLYLPILVNSVGLTLLNHTLGSGSTRDYRHLFWANLRITLGLTTLTAAVIAVGAGPLLSLFGRSFSDGVPVLLVMLVSTIPETLSLACYQATQSQGRMWLSLAALAVPRDLTLVALSAILAPRHGALGLASAFLAAQCVSLVANVLVIRAVGLDPTHAGVSEPVDRLMMENLTVPVLVSQPEKSR